MKQKRRVSMICALVLMISAVVLIVGCSHSGGVQLPDDLRNTNWACQSTDLTLEFGKNTLKTKTDGIVADYIVISAKKDGKIEISAKGTTAVLCESYSISGSILTMKGGMNSIGVKYNKK